MFLANQPLLFPSLYLLDRFLSVNTIVLMGEAQFSKFGLMQRSELTSKNGSQTLIVPLKDRSFKALNEVKIDDYARWLNRFEKTLQCTYGKCSGYKTHKDALMHLLNELSDPTLSQLGELCMRWSASLVEYSGSFVEASDLVTRPEDATEWLVDMAVALKENAYVGGRKAMDSYMRYEPWRAINCKVFCQDWVMPEYKGLSSDLQTGWISFLDPLMIGGVDLLVSLLEKGKRPLREWVGV